MQSTGAPLFDQGDEKRNHHRKDRAHSRDSTYEGTNRGGVILLHLLSEIAFQRGQHGFRNGLLVEAVDAAIRFVDAVAQMFFNLVDAFIEAVDALTKTGFNLVDALREPVFEVVQRPSWRWPRRGPTGFRRCARPARG